MPLVRCPHCLLDQQPPKTPDGKFSCHNCGQRLKAPPPAPPRSLDRHKRRQSLHLRPAVHQLISALAEKHYRPLRMEVELAVFDYLRKHGVVIPPDVLAHDAPSSPAE